MSDTNMDLTRPSAIDLWAWGAGLLLLISLLSLPLQAAPREVRVGVYFNEPKILLDGNGQVSGIFGDILSEIARLEDWELIPVQCNWDECLHALQDGRIDLMTDIAYSRERAEKIDFHKVTVLHNWSAIYHREGTVVDSMLDLQNKRVTILKDSIQESYLRTMLTEFGLQVTLMPVHSLEEGFRKVADREADLAVTNRFFGETMSARYNLIPSPVVYQPNQMFFGTRRGHNADLLQAIDRHLEPWLKQKDSPYFKAVEKWTGQPVLTVVPRWLVISAIALLTLFLFMLLISAYLRHLVNEKTRSLQQGKDALANSEQKLRTILDKVDAYIYLKDINGHYLFANKLALDLLQVNSAGLIGFGDEKFFDAETAANIRRNDQRVLVDGELIKTEETNTVVNTGKTATFLSTKLPLRDDNGNIYALCGISVDITERIHTENALREQREILQIFIEHAPASLAMFDREMRYLAVSRRWLTDYSLMNESVIGHSHYEIFPDIPQHWKNIHRRGLAGEIIKTDEDRFDRMDGSTIWLQWEVRPWKTANGSVGGIIIFSEDITRNKLATEELNRYRRHLEDLVAERTADLSIAKSAAESAYIAKSSFLANMSHEIRTPLNAITSTAYLIRRDGVTPRQAERLDTIDNAGQHLLEIINAVLDLSKIEAGKLDLEEITINIATVVNNVATMLTERAHDKQLSLIVEPVPEPLHLLGDPTRLQQALLNFAANGIKFTQSGSITIRVKIAQETEQHILLRFEVQDTGIGIEPAVAERLFNSFEQGDNTMTRKYGGTGLGLAITKKLAVLMGGDAGVDSTPNVGSTFWFTTNLRKDLAAAEIAVHTKIETASEILARDYKGCRILIADDEPFNRTLIQDILDRIEPRIDTAENGIKAVELATSNEYDLILMDMQMPEMNGVDATIQIRKHPDRTIVPIIALTGNAFSEDKKRCLDAGMNDFITKPFNITLLFETLLKWLSHNQP